MVLDTDTIVDILRRHAPAVRWLEQSKDQQLIISGFSAMEVLAGCRNKTEQDLIQRQLLRRFNVVWLSENACGLALQMYATLHLGNNLGIIDALIAQTALSLSLPLCTFNAKHFAAVPQLNILKPYER